MQPAMTDSGQDEQNLALAHARSDVDAINAQFYGKYPFPPRAHRLERPLDSDFYRTFLCQDLGDFRRQSIPSRPSIWVAGCGTNQALITALAFPRATVVGSDVSVASLETAAQGMRDLGLGNLDLRNESLNHVEYRAEFDYVLCTGVIHHNAEPANALKRIAAALKPGGVLELMVYGRYQRIPSSSVQKALLILAGNESRPGDDRSMAFAQALVNGFDAPGRMGAFLSRLREARPAELADNLLQPVEHSYTVASLDELARRCGLEMLLPAVNELDKLKGDVTWDLSLPSHDLRKAYLQCDEVERWQVANLLLGECSPLLWFYLRRASDTGRPTEREICESFLGERFTAAATRKQAYVLAEDGYQLAPGSIAFPPALSGPLRAVVDSVDGRTPMRDLLERHKMPTEFPEINRIRTRLTTRAFPYLKAVAS